MKIILALFLTLFFIVPFCPQADAHAKKHTRYTRHHRRHKFVEYRQEVTLIKGVSYIKMQHRYFGKPLLIHLLKVNLSVPGISITAGIPGNNINRLWPINMIVKQQGAIAAINGSFFNPAPAHPIGRLIKDGRSLFKEDKTYPRSVFGITHNNEPFIQIPYIIDTIVFEQNHDQKLIISGINQNRQDDDVILYNNAYGDSTRTNDFGDEIIVENNVVKNIVRKKGNSPIPAKGFVISLYGLATNYTNMFSVGTTVNHSYFQSPSWNKVKTAVSGGPRILENRKNVVHPYFNIENFKSSFRVPRARSAVGINAYGEVIMAVVEKTNTSSGITFSELAEIMQSFDCVDAMALDGGSSSALYINPSWYKIRGTDDVPYINNALMVTKN